ncbi:MAG: YitT family protein [Lachnospiraceae bacterium]|nr:YitT family protein [Lachnospiraceae bacterium]MBO5145860.1 YitT family protein [Lachnospiraceae bacterium]
MTKSEIAKRYVLFIISLFFSALGVAVTKHGELGVSPISSAANVLSCKFSFFSLGTWLIIWNCVLIIGQIVILRKAFQPIQLLQVPLSFLFGWFTDFGMRLAAFIPADSYPVRLGLVFLGTVILGFGISLSVIANVIMNSGEAFVKAVSDKSRKEFGNVKIAFDVSCVVLAVVLSLVFFDFTLVGTREGTVIAALLTGIVVKFFTRKFSMPLNRILSGRS